MTLAAKLRRAPIRIAAGAFVLNTGLGKLKGDETQGKALRDMASGAYPFLEKIPPKPFLSALSITEITLGGALLAPIVPAGLAGLGLMAFSGAMLGMWWRTPGMHEEGSPRPTQNGVAIAKDVWMLGIGTSLVIDAALAESPVTGETARANTKAALKAETKAARKSAQRAAKRAGKQAKSLLPN